MLPLIFPGGTFKIYLFLRYKIKGAVPGGQSFVFLGPHGTKLNIRWSVLLTGLS